MMHCALGLFDLHNVIPNLVSARHAILPAAGTALASVSFAMFRGRRFAWEQASKSIMQFASLGTLHCICDADQQDRNVQNRRQFCRGCGCEIVAKDASLLTRELSSREIETMTRRLRQGAARSSRLEIPPTVTTIDELHRYLDSDAPKHPRLGADRAASVEHSRVQE